MTCSSRQPQSVGECLGVGKHRAQLCFHRLQSSSHASSVQTAAQALPAHRPAHAHGAVAEECGVVAGSAGAGQGRVGRRGRGRRHRRGRWGWWADEAVGRQSTDGPASEHAIAVLCWHLPCCQDLGGCGESTTCRLPSTQGHRALTACRRSSPWQSNRRCGRCRSAGSSCCWSAG